MGQKGTIAAMGAVPLIATALVSGGISYLGFRIGTKEKGVLSVVGYVIGVVGGLGAVGSLAATALWLLGVSLIPERPPKPEAPATPVPSFPGPMPAPRFPQTSEFQGMAPAMAPITGPDMGPVMGGPSRFEGVTADEFKKRSVMAAIPVRPIGLFN